MTSLHKTGSIKQNDLIEFNKLNYALDFLSHFVRIGFFILAISVSSCSESPSHTVQGYIEGRYTYIATNVSGILKQIRVDRGSVVDKGNLLFVLDQQPESDVYNATLEELKQRKFSRDATQANLTFSKKTFRRDSALAPDAVAQSVLDKSTADYQSNTAQLAQANAAIATSQANLARAKWELTQKTISAPVSGIVFDKYYRLGEYTEAGKAILSILAPENIKAVFYVREPDLSGIHLNDKIKAKCDSCKQGYTGHISFISPTAEYTPPVIFSNETNSKLLYRVEAKFAATDAFKMHPGQPVKVQYQIHD